MFYFRLLLDSVKLFLGSNQQVVTHHGRTGEYRAFEFVGGDRFQSIGTMNHRNDSFATGKIQITRGQQR